MVVTPAACRGCGVALPSEPGDDDPADERVQVVELPPVRAEVAEYRLAARRCRSCGRITRAVRPAEARGGAFGPRLQAVATLLVGRYRLSRREAVACLAELGEVELSVGALARLEQATSTALAPVVDEVATAVQQAAVANVDETGWWQGRTRRWLWTVVTEMLTLFRLDPSRGKAVVQALLGTDWAGIVGSDRYSAYRYLPLDQRQVCWAHLIREFRKIAAYNQQQRPLGSRLLAIATRIFALWYRSGPPRLIGAPWWWSWCHSRLSSARPLKPGSTLLMLSSPVHSAATCSTSGRRCGPSRTSTASSRPTMPLNARSARPSCGARAASAPRVTAAPASSSGS